MTRSTPLRGRISTSAVEGYISLCPGGLGTEKGPHATGVRVDGFGERFCEDEVVVDDAEAEGTEKGGEVFPRETAGVAVSEILDVDTLARDSTEFRCEFFCGSVFENFEDAGCETVIEVLISIGERLGGVSYLEFRSDAWVVWGAECFRIRNA